MTRAPRDAAWRPDPRAVHGLGQTLAALLRASVVGIERDAEYLPIAEERARHAERWTRHGALDIWLPVVTAIHERQQTLLDAPRSSGDPKPREDAA